MSSPPSSSATPSPGDEEIKRIHTHSSLVSRHRGVDSDNNGVARLNKINFRMNNKQLDELALFLQDVVATDTLRRAVHHYEDCFVGKVAVDHLTTLDIVDDDLDAINILRHLVNRRILIRVDHSRPLLNTFVYTLSPSFGDWRVRRLARYVEPSNLLFNMSHLYRFSPKSFSRYIMHVNVIRARGIVYSKKNVITGKFKKKKPLPFVEVHLGLQKFVTSVEHEEENPVWDETFQFFVDTKNKETQFLWLNVNHFRDIGASSHIGQISIPIAKVLEKCLVRAVEKQPQDIEDCFHWREFHRAHSRSRLPTLGAGKFTALEGGEVEVDIVVTRNVVDEPTETVFESCKPQWAIDGEARPAQESSVSDWSVVGDMPEPNGDHPENQGNAENGNNEQSPASTAPQPDKTAAQTAVWSLNAVGIELHDMKSLSENMVFGVQIEVRSTKTGKIIASDNSKQFSCPKKDKAKKGLPIYDLGNLYLPIPHQKRRHSIVQIKVWKQIEMMKSTMGRGKVEMHRIPRYHDIGERDLPPQAPDDTTSREPSTAGAENIVQPIGERTSFSSDQPDTDSPAGAASMNDVAHLLHNPTMLANKNQVQFAHIIKKTNHPVEEEKTQVVPLRRQAAFKRNVKLKVGTVALSLYLSPWKGNEDDTFNDEYSTDDGELDEDLAVMQTGEQGEKLDIPDALEYVTWDETINAPWRKLANLILLPNSKFLAKFFKVKGNIGTEVSAWEHDPTADEEGEGPHLLETDGDDITPPGSPASTASGISTPHVDDVTPLSPPAKLVSRIGSPKSMNRLTSKPAAESTDENAVDHTDVVVDREKSAGTTQSRITSTNSSEALSVDGSPSVSHVNSTKSADANVLLEEMAKLDIADGSGHHKNPTRFVKYTLPASAFVKATRCTETHTLQGFGCNGFVLDISTVTPDVPYGDIIITRSQVMVVSISETQTRIRCSGETNFTKSPGLMKSVIYNTTKKGQVESYRLYIDLLKQFSAPRSRGRRSSMPDLPVHARKNANANVGFLRRSLRLCFRAALLLVGLVLWSLFMQFVLHATDLDSPLASWFDDAVAAVSKRAAELWEQRGQLREWTVLLA